MYETKYDECTIEQFRKKYRMLLFFDRYLYVFLCIPAAFVAYFCTFRFDFTGKDGTYYCINSSSLRPLIMLVFAAAAFGLWSLTVRIIIKENYHQYRAAVNRGNVRQSRFTVLIACICAAVALALLAYQFTDNISAAKTDKTTILYHKSIHAPAEVIPFDRILTASVSDSGESLLLITNQQHYQIPLKPGSVHREEFLQRIAEKGVLLNSDSNKIY